MNRRIKKKIKNRYGCKKYHKYKIVKDEEILAVGLFLTEIETCAPLYGSMWKKVVKTAGIPKELLE